MSVVVDLLDFLTSQPSAFASMSPSMRADIAGKRPTPDLRSSPRSNQEYPCFSPDWYNKFSWSTGSLKKNKLYCFYCLLFGGDHRWTYDGVTPNKFFLPKATKHEATKHHLLNLEKYILLTTAPLETLPHRSGGSASNVQGLRRAVKRVIKTLCGQFKVGIPDCVNGQDLMSSTIAAAVGNDFESEIGNFGFLKLNTQENCEKLIKSIKKVMKAYVASELSKLNFVALRIEELPITTSLASIAIILRYVLDDRAVERYVCTLKFSFDSPVSSVAADIYKFIKGMELNSKVVSFTLGAGPFLSSLNKSLYSCLRKLCPCNWIIVPAADHNLDFIITRCCQAEEDVKDFLAKLCLVNGFFANPERFKQIKAYVTTLPYGLSDRWETRPGYVSLLKDNITEVKNACTIVSDTLECNWDSETKLLGGIILDILNSNSFLYYLCLFSKIMSMTVSSSKPQTKRLYENVGTISAAVHCLIQAVDSSNNSALVMECEWECNSFLSEFHSSEEEDDCFKSTTCRITQAVEHEISLRYSEYSKAAFSELISEGKFPRYNENFPTNKYIQLLEVVPACNWERLENELRLVYSQEDKQAHPLKLLSYIKTHRLQKVYESVTNLIRLVMTYPFEEVKSPLLPLVDKLVLYSKAASAHEVIRSLEFIAVDHELLSDVTSHQYFYEKALNDFFIEAGLQEYVVSF